jgi:hypothetical protein
MKSLFSRARAVRFIPPVVVVVLGLLGACRPASAADDSYINDSVVNNPPQIDALRFINLGTINISTTDPFETSDTLFYTNSGTMAGAVGWRFDNAPPDNGLRQMADTFVNSAVGTIQAADSTSIAIIGIPVVSPITPSYLWIHATNIVNQGLLRVGANGWLQLAGTNVNVSRSGLEVVDIAQSGAVGSINNPPGTNFLGAAGISDVWWGQTNLNFSSANIWDGQSASAPPHPVQEVGGFGTVVFGLPGPFADSYSNSFGVVMSVTNIVGIPNPGPVLTNISKTNILIQNIYFPTNIYKQGVFIGISDPTTLSAAVTYFPSTSITNPFKTVSAQITFLSTNVITAALEPTTLYFYDMLASETNRGLFQNINSPLTFRPANYLLSRRDERRMFASGISGSGVPDAGFLYDKATFSNNVVAGEYAAYNAFVDDIVAEPPPVTGGTVTNLPGRVQIIADSLDMRSTRIRGAGFVSANARHLVGSSGAAVDCENLIYNLASTNGNLAIANLAKDSVARLKGNIVAWSGLWSNSMSFVYMNNYSISNILDTNGVVIGIEADQAPITNGAAVNLHAFLIDGDELQTQIPVITWDMNARSTNVVIDDNMTVVESFLLDGLSFTLNGNITFSQATLQTAIGTQFSSSLSDWIHTNAPTLAYFTNHGTLTLPGAGHFGDDRPQPYTDFVNTGTINATAINISSTYLQNNGSLAAGGPLNMVVGTGTLENGQSTAGGDAKITCTDLKLNKYQMSVSGFLQVNAINSLLDAGASSGNQITVQSGLTVLTKPSMGDLIGTALVLQPPNFIEADHTWPAEDRGATSGGYVNNLALGKLILSPQSVDAVRAPLFVFKGAGGTNAIYADLLDLSKMGANWTLIQQQMLQIDPNIVIYYAAAKLGFTPPPNPVGIPVEPEEFLDGQFGGHLRWVSSFAGPNSSVDVIINGVTVAVNKALRFSKIIDSNGNGIPNFYDPNPFNTPPTVLTAVVNPGPNPASRSVAVSWNAIPNTVYHVEFCTSVQEANWQPLTDYTSSSKVTQRVTIWDPNAPVNVQRFYRVRYAQ